MKEIWKPIPEFEGLYEASNLGRVRSVDRYIIGKDGVKKRFSGRILVPKLIKEGYFTVSLSKNNFAKTVKSHRLVAKLFIENPDNLPQVNHIDGNKTNNIATNLEWVTAAQNASHAVAMGLTLSGEAHPYATLSNEQAMYVKYLMMLNIHMDEISKMLNVSKNVVSNISCGRSWKNIHITGQWVEMRKEDGLVRRISYDVSSVN